MRQLYLIFLLKQDKFGKKKRIYEINVQYIQNLIVQGQNRTDNIVMIIKKNKLNGRKETNQK